MSTIEFVTTVVDGAIPVPASHRDRLRGEVRVFVVTNDDVQGDAWPDKNRRRWHLIVKRETEGLADDETRELQELEKELESQRSRLGDYPSTQIEELYAELTRDQHA